MSNENEWQKRFAEQARSGLSIAQWCRQKGLRANRYYYWKQRLGGSGLEASKKNFVEISRGEAIELQIRENIRIRVSANFDRAALKGLLELLGC